MRGRLIIALVVLMLAAASAHATQYAGSRALVSRSRADMRALAMALEAYRADLGTYPPTGVSPEWQVSERLLLAPSVGMTMLPQDPFRRLTMRAPGSLWPIHARDLLLCFAGWLILAGIFYSFFMLVNVATRGLEAWKEMRRSRAVEAVILGGILMIVTRCGAPVPHPSERLHPNRAFEHRPHGHGYWTDGTHWILQGLGPDGARTLDDLSAVPIAASPEAVEVFLVPFTYDPTNGIASSGDLFHVAE